MQQRTHYNNFLIKCCVNSFLINQHNNNRFTSFCYDWIMISTLLELYVTRKFNVQLFLWNWSFISHEKVWIIMFDYVDDKMLSQIQINSDIANQTHAVLRELHQTSILHDDIRASNILVSNNWINFIDLNVSLAMSHIKILAWELKKLQEREFQKLEIEFVLLFKICINQLFEY